MFTFYGDVETKPAIAVVENFYSPLDLRLIWRELEFLTSEFKLKLPEETGSATYNDGSFKKQNRAIFLDSCFPNREVSDILRVNRGVFAADVVTELEKVNTVFKVIRRCEKDTTLLSYYEDGDYYKPHSDKAMMTILSYFVKDESKVSGGELYFPEFDLTIEVKNNMVVFMPSHYQHEVKPVKCSKNGYSTYGRYCMAQFVLPK